MKLINLNTEFYLLGDDKIKSGDLFYNSNTKRIGKISDYTSGLFKIVASTEKIEGIPMLDKKQIESLFCKIYIDKKAKEYFEKKMDNSEGFDLKHGWKKIFKEGYTQALEDNAHKVFTLQDMKHCFEESREKITHPDWDYIHDDFEGYMKIFHGQENEWHSYSEWDNVEIEMVKSSLQYANSSSSELVPKVNEKGYITITSIK